MNLNKLKETKICKKCPYKQGKVHTPSNPCPSCKENGYNMLKIFENQIDKS